MPVPLWKYDRWLCPVCGNKLSLSIVTYKQIDSGIFQTDKTIKETTYRCLECSWSYWTKEIE